MDSDIMYNAPLRRKSLTSSGNASAISTMSSNEYIQQKMN